MEIKRVKQVKHRKTSNDRSVLPFRFDKMPWKCREWSCNWVMNPRTSTKHFVKWCKSQKISRNSTKRKFSTRQATQALLPILFQGTGPHHLSKEETRRGVQTPGDVLSAELSDAKLGNWKVPWKPNMHQTLWSKTNHRDLRISSCHWPISRWECMEHDRSCVPFRLRKEGVVWVRLW